MYLGGEAHGGIIYLTDAIEIYYNPISGNLCNSSDSVSTTGTITGCMRWYLYSIDDDYANMLLDHNITEAKSNAGAWALKDDYAAGLTPIMDGETITGYQITEGEGSKAITAGVTYPGVSSFDSYEPFGSNERGP